jgi:hypothetical protein
MTPELAFFLAAQVIAVLYVRARFGMHFTLTSMFLLVLVAIHGVPFLIFFHSTGPDTFVYEAVLSHRDAAAIESRLLMAIASMLLFSILGSELARIALPTWYNQGKSSLGRSDDAIDSAYELSAYTKGALWLLVGCMAAVSLYEGQLLKVYEFYSSGGFDIEKVEMRRDYGGSSIYLYNVVLFSVAPFLVMVSGLNAWRKGGGWPLAIALLAVVLLGKLATLQKAPPTIFVLQLILCSMLLRGHRLNLKLIAVVSALVLVLFIGVIFLTMPEVDLSSALEFFYYRTFDVPNQSLLEYFAAYPAVLPYRMGAGFVGKFFDPNYLPAYLEVADLVRASLDSSSNAVFIGDAWAEFGWWGVCVLSVGAGFVVRAIDIYSHRNGVSDESVAVVAACTFGVFTLLSTSLTTGLLTGGLAVIPVVSALLVRQSATFSSAASKYRSVSAGRLK